jgi:hypothetical protein
MLLFEIWDSRGGQSEDHCLLGCHAEWFKGTNISKEPAATIFRVDESSTLMMEVTGHIHCRSLDVQEILFTDESLSRLSPLILILLIARIEKCIFL